MGDGGEGSQRNLPAAPAYHCKQNRDFSRVHEMPSVGSITKTIRLSPIDREYIESLMSERGLTWSGAVHYVISGGTRSEEEIVQSLMDRAVYRDIKKKCKANGISTHDFYRGILELWEKGKIEIVDGKVRSNGEWRTKEFETACYKIGKLPQEVIDAVTRGLK